MRVVNESFANQTVVLPVGQVLEVRLAENPTTGFRWQVAAAGDPACVLVEDVAEHGSGPPGRGGEHAWRFRAARPGESEITLHYRRPWESGEGGEAGAPPARSFTLRVRVTG